MAGKRIFVLDGHPAANSISRQWAEAYCDAAVKAGHQVRILHLYEMEFDPDFGNRGYHNPKPLEPDLEVAMEDIKWAQHIVLSTPMWWGGLPAILKGFFDRAFLPGRAFDSRNKTLLGVPKPLLSDRTGRIMITADTPGWYLRLRYGNAIKNQLRGQLFGFVGIKPTRFSYYAGASEPSEGAVSRWLDDARKLGVAAA